VVSPSFVSSQLVVTVAVTVLDTHLGFHENPKVISRALRGDCICQPKMLGGWTKAGDEPNVA
jgi:hypothetical protein